MTLSFPDDAVIKQEIAFSGCWKPILGNFLQRFSEGTFIDVGAHVGLVTVPLAVAKPGLRCIAFEPHPGNFAALEENVRVSGATVELHQAAVGARCGEVTFEHCTENSVDHRVRTHQRPGAFGEENRPTSIVRITTLDRWAGRLPRPIILKIDAQGFDIAVLRGARELKPDLVVMELWPYGLLRAGETLQTVMEELKRFSYGAPLIDSGVSLRRDLHLEVAAAVPWERPTEHHSDLVLSNGMGAMNKPLTVHITGLTGRDLIEELILPEKWHAKIIARMLLKNGWDKADLADTPALFRMPNGRCFRILDQKGNVRDATAEERGELLAASPPKF